MLLDNDNNIMETNNKFLDWSTNLKTSFRDQLLYYVEERYKDPDYQEHFTYMGSLKADPFPFGVNLHVFIIPEEKYLQTVTWNIGVVFKEDTIEEVNRCVRFAFEMITERLEAEEDLKYTQIRPYSIWETRNYFPYTLRVQFDY